MLGMSLRRPTLDYPPRVGRATANAPAGVGVTLLSSMVLGAALGVGLPCAGYVHLVRTTGDPGGPLVLPLLILVGLPLGALVGAVVGPLVAVPAHYLLWHLTGRR